MLKSALQHAPAWQLGLHQLVNERKDDVSDPILLSYAKQPFQMSVTHMQAGQQMQTASYPPMTLKACCELPLMGDVYLFGDSVSFPGIRGVTVQSRTEAWHCTEWLTLETAATLRGNSVAAYRFCAVT
jgi:hypothetical protein